MNIVFRILCLVMGYCFGMIQWAYILGRKNGIDIREHGSGNSGTTNALRVMGPRTGIAVFLLDMCKSLLAILLTGLLFGKSHPELVYLLKMYTMAGCVLGHDFPFYMNFRGGKGVAVMAGFVFAFHISFFPIAVLLFFGPFLLTHFVSLGSLMLYAGVLIQVIVEGQMGLFAPASQSTLIELYVIQALLTCMAWYRHRANIRRLLGGNESKTYLRKH